MEQLWMGGGIGLLFGLGLQLAGASDNTVVRDMLRFRRLRLMKILVFGIGFGALCVAVLGWLAVLDVDQMVIKPLNSGVLIGGAIFGLAFGALGRCPGTALSGVGGGQFLPSLCTVIGGVAGALVYALLYAPLSGLNELFAPVTSTLFRVTLTTPYLWSGGFLGHGCLGILLMVLAVCIRLPRDTPAEQAAPADGVGDAAELEPIIYSAEETAEKPPTPEAAAVETVIASLPQEEPLMLDSAAVELHEAVTEALDRERKPEEEAMEPKKEEKHHEGESHESSKDEPMDTVDVLPEEWADEPIRAVNTKTPTVSTSGPVEEPVPRVIPSESEDDKDPNP